MEDENCSYKYITDEEVKKTEYANNSPAGTVFLSKQDQERAKYLMLSALKDPRENYKTITIDEMTKDWIKQ